jgi:hypothetical protein
VLALFESHGVPTRKIGAVSGEVLRVNVGAQTPCELAWPVPELHRAWDESLGTYLNL